MIEALWGMLHVHYGKHAYEQFTVSGCVWNNRHDAAIIANHCNYDFVDNDVVKTIWVAMPYSEAWEWRACEVWRQEAAELELERNQASEKRRLAGIVSLGSYRDQMRDAGRGHLVR